jgi:hypothetical protein
VSITRMCSGPVLAILTLAVALSLASGCSATPPQTTTASAPVAESSSTASGAVDITNSLPTYEFAAERKAVLAAAQRYLGVSSTPYVIHVVLQQPSALASLGTSDGATWVVALRRTGTGADSSPTVGWRGVWKHQMDVSARSDLARAGVFDAPDAVMMFTWAIPTSWRPTVASASEAIKTTLNARVAGEVESVRIKALAGDQSSGYWAAGTVQSAQGQRAVIGHMQVGKPWTIVAYASKIDRAAIRNRVAADVATRLEQALGQ